MGQPTWQQVSDYVGGQPAELKHLSKRGKENKSDSPSSGERKGNSLNQYCFGNVGVVGLRYMS